MIINKSYTVKIITPDGAQGAIINIWADDESLVEYTLIDDLLTIKTLNKLGETNIHIEGVNSDILTIPVIIDNIIYEYNLEYNNKFIVENEPTIVYYNAENPVQELKIVETRWSTLFNRYLNDVDEKSLPFDVDINYSKTAENFTADVIGDILKLNMLSPYSRTDLNLIITSADGSTHSLNTNISIIDGDRLDSIPSGTFKLSERTTSYETLYITGTESEIFVEEPTVNEFFKYNIDGNKINILPLKGSSNILPLTVSSTYNGTLKKLNTGIFIKPTPLTFGHENLVNANVNEITKITIFNVIGDLTVEGDDIIGDTFSYTIDYIRDEFKAIVNITPNTITPEGKLIFKDFVPGRKIRITEGAVKFNKDIVLTLESEKVVALDLPAKIRFIQAKGNLKVVALSAFDGNQVRTKVVFDINPYNQNIDKTQGYIYVYPTKAAKVAVRVTDRTSYADVSFMVEKSDKKIYGWVPVLPNTKIDNLAGNLNSPVNYSNSRLKAGDFVGNQWIEGAKFGNHKLTKIRYKVSPPDEIIGDTNAGLVWLNKLKDTSSILAIDIRDGFLLEDLGKKVTVASHWISDNIFETEPLEDQEIYFEDAQTPLISDLNNRISLTTNRKRDGIIIYLDENNIETITSRVELEPIAFFEYVTVTERKKMPLSKPGNCYDIKRLNGDVESGKFVIFPSATEDTPINVQCEFNKDINGNDDIWTVIPETSIRKFADVLGRYIGENNTKIDAVVNNGIRPRFYPDNYNSSQSPSYLFLEFPFNVKSFSYKLNTIEHSDNAMGTFKIMTDTSDIFNINGEIDNKAMNTRSNTLVEFNLNAVKKNIGQVVVVPDDYSQYASTVNAPIGSITPDTPTDRIVISNTGAENGFDISQTFLQELRFKSIFDSNNISNKLWKQRKSSIDITSKIVKLSTKNSAIISYFDNKIMDLSETIRVSTNNDYIISESNDDLVDLSEFISLYSKNKSIISNTDSEVAELDFNGKIYNSNPTYNISNVYSPIVDTSDKLFSTKTPITTFSTNKFIYNISVESSEIIEIQVNTKLSKKDNKNIISDTKQFDLIDLSENLKLDTTTHSIISDLNNQNIIDIENNTDLTADNISIISSNDSDIMDLAEAIKIFDLKHENIISYDNSNIIEPIYAVKLNAYHPTVIGQEDLEIIDIPTEIIFETRILPFSIYQDETVAMDNTDEIVLDFRNIEFNGNLNYVIEQKYIPELVPNNINIEFNGNLNYVIEQKDVMIQNITMDYANVSFVGGMVTFEDKLNDETQIAVPRGSKISSIEHNVIIKESKVDIISPSDRTKIASIEHNIITPDENYGVSCQTKSKIFNLTEQQNVVKGNTFITDQKYTRVIELEEQVKLYLPIVTFDDITAEITDIEFNGNDKKLISVFDENNNRLTDIVELSVSDKSDEFSINTIKDNTNEIVETVSII